MRVSSRRTTRYVVILATATLAFSGCIAYFNGPASVDSTVGDGGATALPSQQAMATVGQSTPLHDAAANGHVEGVQNLVRAGADVNARDEQGRTPLHLAATHGHGQTAEALLALDADVGAVDLEGRAPRYYAEQNGHNGTAALLTNPGVTVAPAS